MQKTKLTLYVDGDLIEQMKHRALDEKMSLSNLTQQLYREFLKRGKAKK